ncbi:TadE/TadG family type IV pilus assembly protein [Promicromonospora sukumoe]|uniref:TadE/TadG family type IV pilus assembly protein n=1 Tax=Promicromonospora sukumoe TaxID=88382 RepID=UPI0037CA0EC5
MTRPHTTCIRIRPRRRGAPETGVAAIELVVTILPAIAVCWGMAFGALYALAHQSVQAAAADAARTASLARSAPTAQASAHATAVMALANQDVRCASTDVSVDTAGLLAPAGQPSTVSATVVCRLDPIRLGLPIGRPVTVSASMSSPVDTWRSQ